MKILIKNAKLSFNDLFKAKLIGDNPDPKYSATLICLDPKEDSQDVFEKVGTTFSISKPNGVKIDGPYTDLSLVIEDIIKEKFKGEVPIRIKNWAYNKADGSTTRDKYIDTKGERKGEYRAGFDENTYYISASKKAKDLRGEPLKVVDQEKNVIVAEDIERGRSKRIFSGCYVNAVVDIYAYEIKNKEGAVTGSGVTATIEAVQLIKKGEALFSAPKKAVDDFEEVQFEEEAGLLD